MPTIFQQWNNDPEFIALDLSSKARIYLNFFDRNMADDEFEALDPKEQRRIKTNFIHAQGVDLGPGPAAPEEKPGILDPYKKAIQDIREKLKKEEYFDPESKDYDYETALSSGIEPDETGHWPSLDPRTGMLLKGIKRPTIYLTLKEEERLGNRIFKKGDRYYSEPIEKEIRAGIIPEEVGATQIDVRKIVPEEEISPISPEARPPGIYPDISKPSLLERGIGAISQMLGLPSPLARERGISEEAGAGALVELMAKEKGMPLAEYRESPEFIEQFAQGFTDVASFGLLPALRSAFEGKEPIPPTDIKGKFGSGLGSFAGLIFGPGKAVGQAVSPLLKRLPQVTANTPRLSRVLKQGLKESLHLSPVIAGAEVGRAIEERSFRDSASVILEGLKSGAFTGAIFGTVRGLFPKEAQQRAYRIITGWLALNAQRIIEDPNHAGPWDRPAEDIVFDTIMDTYFMWRGLPSKKHFTTLQNKVQERRLKGWQYILGEKEYPLKDQISEIYRKRFETPEIAKKYKLEPAHEVKEKVPRETLEKPEKAPTTEVLKDEFVTDEETNTRAEIVKIDKVYSVIVRDLDSGKVFPEGKIFKTLDEAKKFAKTILPKEKPPPEVKAPEKVQPEAAEEAREGKEPEIRLYGDEKVEFKEMPKEDIKDLLKDDPFLFEGAEVTIRGEKYEAGEIIYQKPKVKEFVTRGKKKQKVPEIKYQEFEPIKDGETLELTADEIWNQLRLKPEERQKKLALEVGKLPEKEVIPFDDWRGTLPKTRDYAQKLGIKRQDIWSDHEALIKAVEKHLAPEKPKEVKEPEIVIEEPLTGKIVKEIPKEKPTVSWDVKKVFAEEQIKSKQKLSFVGDLIERKDLPNDWVRLKFKKIGEEPKGKEEVKEPEKIEKAPTYTLNEAQRGVELRFPDKPDPDVINRIKLAGFRWSPKQKIWYAKQNPDRIRLAKALTKPTEKPILKVEEEVGKPREIRPTGKEPLERVPPKDVLKPEGERRPVSRPEGVRREGEEPTGRAGRERAPTPRGVGVGEGAGVTPERGRPTKPERKPITRTEQPTREGNYRITDKDPLEEGGAVTKFKRNIDAIKLLKKIEGEGRLATPEEQAILVQYSGWGGIPETFKSYFYGEDKWEKRQEQLKEILTDEEYKAGRASTPNAHFTSPAVIKSIYKALEKAGFSKGRVLEPSMGIGHFFGQIPPEWKVKLTGVEIDPISGRIAKQLYQDADVRVQGFEETKLPDNFFDLAISNVPFGDYKLHDPKYDKYKFNIHDYFFAKSIDKVRPGGLIAFITSSGTMDKKGRRVRKYIAERTELLAAVRLPGDAFKKVANTEVTTDIIFLRKLEEGEKPKGLEWIETKDWKTKEDYVFPINEYFHKYPHMMLGEVVPDKLHYRRAGLESDGRNLEESLGKIIEDHIPVDIFKAPVHKATLEPDTNDMIPPPEEVKNYGYFEKDNKIYQKQDDESISIALEKKDVNRMKSFLSLRDTVRTTLRNQLEGINEKLKSDLKSLNQKYDTFVKKHGYLHTQKNNKLFQEDPDHALLLSLEKWDAEAKEATKADIFNKKVMARYEPVKSVDTAHEALTATLFDRGTVDFDHMSRISGKSPEALQQELTGTVYKDPEGGKWITNDEYLSGNVRNKLEAARAAAKLDKSFEPNVKALEKVQPEDLKASQIHARIGSNWIPENDYSAYINELIAGRGLNVRYVPETSAYVMDKPTRTWEYSINDSLNTREWGTSDIPAVKLFEMSLNHKIAMVRRTDPVTDKRYVDEKATALAQVKQQEMKEHFLKWIWEDAERRQRLTRKYNDEFNNIRLRRFDGSHIDKLPGMSRYIEFRPHQKDAIWRIIHGKNTLLEHVVGSGKTFTITAGAMELRRLGLAKKPLITVPKHLLHQWKHDFLELYPAAKILVPSETDFTPKKRKEFMSRITTGDWDSVIVTHDQFGKLPMSKKAQNDFIRQQITDLTMAAEREREINGKSKTVKELEKAKNRLVFKLKNKLEQGEKDETVTFEELGVDYLFVDESHKFKNLWFATRMTRVAGLPNTEAARATDMFLKSQYLTALNNGRGVVFSTGTPISNTMAEMFNVQRYMDMNTLRGINIHNFDAWAGNFGEVTTGFEVTPTGAGYRVNSRFNKFVNLPELQSLFRTNADVVLQEDINIPIPDIKDGKAKAISAQGSKELKAYVNELVDRMKAIKQKLVEPTEDNPLKVTTDGRKAALDMRLVDPSLKDNPDSKVNLMIDNVAKIHKRTKDNKLTQLIFCDFSKPDKTKFSVYNDVKEKLIKKGIPKSELAFIHDATSDAKKVKLFQNVNEGKVRILMGSTAKMGEGMNVQRKLIALHDLDAPWRPSDIEQRLGRIQRQGNSNPEIEVYRYVTKGSFDAYMWQTLEGKARFINQVMKGESGMRTAEDIEAITLTYAEVKAIASANPLILDKVKVDAELRKTHLLRGNWQEQKFKYQEDIARLPENIARLENIVGKIQKDIQNRDANPITDETFKIEIEGKTYTDKDKAKEALFDFIKKAESEKLSDVSFGKYRGFELFLHHAASGEYPNTISIKGNFDHRGDIRELNLYENKSTAKTAILRRFNDTLNGLESSLEGYQAGVIKNKKSLSQVQKLVDKDFEHEERLKELEVKQKDLEKKLSNVEKEGEAEIEEIPEKELAGLPIKREPIPPVPQRDKITQVKRNMLLAHVQKKLDVPIKVGKFRKTLFGQKRAGIYKEKAKVVRLARANDVEIAMHEVGHHLQTLLELPKEMPEEIQRLAYEGAKDINKEGFAEFIRMYVTNETEAKMRAPVFYEEFEVALKRNPDVQDLLVTARQSWNDWIATPSVEKVGSFIVSGKGDKKKRPTLNQFYTMLIDELRPLQVVKEIAEKRRGKLFRPQEDPFLLAWLNRGWARKAGQYLKWGTFQLRPEGVKFTGPALREILRPIEKKGERHHLDRYLFAKRALSDKRIQKGFKGILSLEDFQQTVKELEPKYKDTANQLYKYSNEVLTFLLESGRINQDTADAIRKANLFYAPLYRVMDAEAPLKGLNKKKYANLFQPIKRLKGSSRDIYSPTDSLLYNTYVMMNVAERNRVGRALANLTKIEGMGEWIEKIPFPVKPVKMGFEEAMRSIAKQMDLPQKDVIDIFENSGMGEDMLKMIVTTFRPNYRTGPNEAIFYRDGKPELYELAPDLYSAVQAIDAEGLGMFTRALSYPAKWLRAGATLSPEFISRNPARDQWTAFVYSKYGYIPGYDLVRGAFHILGRSKAYQEYNASGAAHAALVSLDRNYLSKNIKQLMEGRTVKRVIKHPLEGLQILSELTEEATRVSEFIRALKKEGKDLDALLLGGKAARDITLDFSRLGLKTKAYNAITAFWNAQVQGTDKMIRAHKDQPVKTFMKAFLGLTIPSVLLYMAQRDDPFYQEIPTWRRILFWNWITYPDGKPGEIDPKEVKKQFKDFGQFRWESVMDGKRVHIWSIPKPFELGILYGSVPEMALDWYYTKQPEGFNEMLKTLITGLFPSVIPTFGVPIAEWWGNRSLFFDRPIVPRSKEELEPVVQYGPHTFESVKAVTRLMDKVPGLEKVASPAKIQNMIFGYTGGLGRLALEQIDELIDVFGIIKMPPEPSMSISDIPGLRGFHQRFPTANSRSIETFYNRFIEARKKWETEKEKADIRGLGLTPKEMKKIGKPKPQELIRYEMFAKSLSLLRKTAASIYESKTIKPEEKREKLNQIYYLMIDVARTGIGKQTIRKAVNE